MKQIFIASFFIIILFISKSGNAQVWSWAKAMGDTTGNTALYDMYLLPDSSVLLAGSFESKTLVLGKQILQNKGTIDVLVAKIDSSGQYRWALSFGGTNEERATAVAGDQQGNVYVAGNYTSSSINLGGSSIHNKGESDAFLVKINQNNTFEWAMSFGEGASDEVTDIAVDNDGNVILTGYTVDFPSNEFSFFMAKISPQKQLLWQQKVKASNYHPMTTSLKIDQEQYIYLAGSFNDTLRFDKNNSIVSTLAGEAPFQYHEPNAFVAKYDSQGNFVKAINITGFSKVNDMTLYENKLYLCGEKINYGIGWGWPLMDSKIYLAKFDTQLQAEWEKSTGGESPLQSLDIARSVTTDNVGNVYLTGSFFSPKLTFAGNQLNNPKNKEYYHQQTFILKYDADGNEIWGRVIGENLCDIGYKIAATTEDAFFLAGTYESAQINLGDHQLKNNGKIYMQYVHLRPERESRRTFAYVALHGTVVTGTDQFPASHQITLYPNPATNRFSIVLPEHRSAEVSLYLHNGRLINTYYVDGDTRKLEIETGGLERGLYLVKTKINQHVLVEKLVIQ